MKNEVVNHLKVNSDLAENLKFLTENVSSKIVFSTSFGIEDQLITDVVFSQNLSDIEIFTLDTGRFFQETYATWHKTELQYNRKIKTYYPNAHDLESFVNENGINSFYESIEQRKKCCEIRKVVPLKRALQGVNVWITGVRAEHSPNRNELEIIQWDDQNQLFKYNPLLHWTTDEVKNYVQKKGIPYNVLHDEGFISIGCAPCTRAVKDGEDFRAGRWWWEDVSKKECGLHG